METSVPKDHSRRCKASPDLSSHPTSPPPYPTQVGALTSQSHFHGSHLSMEWVSKNLWLCFQMATWALNPALLTPHPLPFSSDTLPGCKRQCVLRESQQGHGECLYHGCVAKSLGPFERKCKWPHSLGGGFWSGSQVTISGQLQMTCCNFLAPALPLWKGLIAACPGPSVGSNAQGM